MHTGHCFCGRVKFEVAGPAKYACFCHDVTLTSFDDPSEFSPQAHIWVEDKAPWVIIGDDLPQFQKKVQ